MMSRWRLAVVMGLTVVLAACRAEAAIEPTLAEEAAFREAVDKVAAAVVRIEPVAGASGAAAEPGSDAPPSTGLVIDPRGLVLAASFAVPEAAREAVIVLPDGRRVAAKPLGRDIPRGIVVLATAPLPHAPALEAVARAHLEPGQWAIAVGRGWSAAEPSVSVGILSATDRAWGLAVQTDAAVSPMNYGGPLVDIAGRVIGIVAPLPAESATLMRGTELYDAGIGFAVPLADLLPLLPRLAAGETLAGGILGVAYRDRDPINGEPVIASVRQGSPAARAGLRPGDRITSVDGRRVRRIADARHAIAPRHAGDALDVEVARGRNDGADVIRTRPTLVASLPPWRRAILGLVLAADAEAGGDDSTRIDWVLPGGPAAAAGLTAGGSIVSLTPLDDGASGDETVDQPSAAALAGVLAGLEPGRHVRLRVQRGGDATTLDVALGEMIADVPDEAPPPPAAGVPGGAADAVRVMRLARADVAEPPLAVVPAGRWPLPVLIWFGAPHGPVDEAEASAWKAAAATTGVAVVLPGSRERREWSGDDVAGVVRAIESLHAQRPIDSARVAVAGRGAGGTFAWLVAERLAAVCRGVAVVDAPLPSRIEIESAEPGAARWLLLGGGRDAAGERRLAAETERFRRAGHAVGRLPAADAEGPPVSLLCRWVALLGLL